MTEVSPARRRELKALAHHLEPVVSVSARGLADSVLKEIDVALRAHELIKIRIFGDDREQRKEFMKRICELTGASPVQSIGKLLVIWREAPEMSDEPVAKKKPGSRKPLTKRAAQELDNHKLR